MKICIFHAENYTINFPQIVQNTLIQEKSKNEELGEKNYKLKVGTGICHLYTVLIKSKNL